MTKKVQKKDTVKRKMKIGQLAKDCNCSRSTIHHYMNLGLLHEPEKQGTTIALYDESHFSRLKKIMQLRKEQKLPLTTIKKMILPSHR